MFGNEESARNFFRNATKKLVPGGLMALTFPDHKVIMDRFEKSSNFDEKSQTYTIGNKFYSIRMTKNQLENARDPNY